MFIHDIDNDKLNSGTRLLSVYPENFEKWELYQEINILGDWNQTKKTAVTAVDVTCAIINIWKNKPHQDVVVLSIKKIQILVKKRAPQNGCF